MLLVVAHALEKALQRLAAPVACPLHNDIIPSHHNVFTYSLTTHHILSSRSILWMSLNSSDGLTMQSDASTTFSSVPPLTRATSPEVSPPHMNTTVLSGLNLATRCSLVTEATSHLRPRWTPSVRLATTRGRISSVWRGTYPKRKCAVLRALRNVLASWWPSLVWSCRCSWCFCSLCGRS